jgi:hypothetical protein
MMARIHPCTIDVELSTNVVLNASALVGLLTVSWKDIIVSPGQSLDVRVAPDERGHLDGVNIGLWPPIIDSEVSNLWHAVP